MHTLFHNMLPCVALPGSNRVTGVDSKSGLPGQGKKSGNFLFFPGEGKVREL